MEESIRINRFLADGGLGSRRQVEKLVSEGRVSVNGKVISELRTRVNATQDLVEVDGKAVQVTKKEDVWMYHKPLDCLCTRKDPKGRRTIFDDLPHLPPPFQAVGRLDQNSTGLLLITNRGDLSQALMHPKYEIVKIYEVLVEGKWSDKKAERLKQGVIMREGGEGRALVLSAKKKAQGQTFLKLELRRGKKREIRYSMEALSMKVLSLHRTNLGPLKLGQLPKGQSRVLSQAEMEQLESLF